jgi:hypothetical protein
VELDLKSNIAPEVIVSKLQEKAKLEFIGVNLKPTEEEKNELEKKLQCFLKSSPDRRSNWTGRELSNQKEHLKIKTNGKNISSFENAIKILKNLEPPFKSIEDDFDNMESNNFRFIYYNEKIVDDLLDESFKRISMDTCFKMGKITIKNSIPKIATVAIKLCN